MKFTLLGKPWVKATEMSRYWDVAVAVHPFGIHNFSGGFSDQNHAMQIVEPWFYGNWWSFQCGSRISGRGKWWSKWSKFWDRQCSYRQTREFFLGGFNHLPQLLGMCGFVQKSLDHQLIFRIRWPQFWGIAATVPMNITPPPSHEMLKIHPQCVVEKSLVQSPTNNPLLSSTPVSSQVVFPAYHHPTGLFHMGFTTKWTCALKNDEGW